MNIPNTLLLEELLGPVSIAHERINEIIDTLDHTDEVALRNIHDSLLKNMNQGMFTFALSTFEIMLQDVLVSVLIGFPKKISDIKLTVNEFVENDNAIDAINTAAEKFVLGLMYKSLDEILRIFGKITGCDQSEFLTEDQLKKLIEYKATRNLLLHNALRVNEIYILKSGPYDRSQGLDHPIGHLLSIDSVYLKDALITIKSVIGAIESGLKEKYKSYTRVEALKRLWDYMIFRPQITPFEEYWEIDAERDVIIIKENPEFENRMSSTERYFLSIWRDLLLNRRSPSYDHNFSFWEFDFSSRKKAALFLSLSHKFINVCESKKVTNKI